MRHRLWLLGTSALAVAFTVVTAACTVSVTSHDQIVPPPSVSRAATTTAAPAAAGQRVDWGTCDDAPAPFECGTIRVPLDHAKPNGESIGIALVRLPATNTSHSLGPLLVNPGGPGGSGIDFVEGNLWPRAITDNFDLIGFDPRGVGASTPISCGFDIGKLYAPDPAPQNAKAVAALEDVSKAYVASCKTHAAKMLAHMGTRDVADDMDDIRQALGVDKINYLGYSYGTSIGQVYADRHPTHIRAMVLDGVVRLGQDGIEAARDQGVAFDEVLGQFFDECDKASSGCSLDDRTSSVFGSIRDTLRRAPMRTDDPKRPLQIGQFHLGVGQALYARSLWPTLARAMNDAEAGDGTGLQDLADQYLGREDDGTYDNQTDVYFAVSCLDWSWPSDPNAYLQAGRDVAKTSPFLAEGIITDYIRCAWWPQRPKPLTMPKAKGSPLIVVVSTTNDPATPYANGVDLAKALPNGALISHVGSEHTAYGRGDSCVDNAVEAYLVSLRRPAEGLRCD